MKTILQYSPRPLADYDRAIARGADWIVSHQEANGSHGPDAPDVMAYYSCPLALQSAGRPPEALACLDYIEANFVRPDNSLAVPDSMSGMAPYPAAWLVRGSLQWGRLGLAHRLMEYVLRFQDGRSGGFFGSSGEAEAGAGTIEFYTSAMATLGCLWTGRFEAAFRAAEYFLTLERLQPEPDRRFYYRMKSDGTLVTDPGELNPQHVFVDRERALQHHVVEGTFAAVMVNLNRVRPHREYLTAAARVVDFALGAPPEYVLRTRHSHKLSWGAAELYQQTGEPRFRTASLQIADYLIEVQESDGRWHYKEEIPRLEDQSLAMSFDMTAQQICWIAKAREVWKR